MSKKKETILHAATILFANQGYRQTSMAELSRLTGVAEGTIFYHFKAKEDIFLSVLKSVQNRLDLAFKNAGECQNGSTGLEKVLAAVTAYLSLAGEMKDEFLMLQRHFPYQISQRNPECRAVLEAITAGFLDFFETALMEGQTDGSIRVPSTRKSAMILYAMADGITRLQTYNIYSSGTLYQELMQMCRRMLQAGGKTTQTATRTVETADGF